MAPVFLGAEDHPPRDRRPKCLTGSAITLVRSARPNPRGRHARVADPSGVECQRDGSDQGQRMEAGDGVLTPDRRPAPSRDANRSPAVPPRWSQRIVMFQTGISRISMPSDEFEGGPLAPPDLWHEAASRRTLAPSVSFRLDQPSRKGSSPAWGETARQAPVRRPEPGPGSAGMCYSLPCRSSAVGQCETYLEISALDCQKNIAYFLTYDDDVRLRSRSSHEACPRKRTRQRVHAARLPRHGRTCCG